MTVKKKNVVQLINEKLAEEFINKGAKTVMESVVDDNHETKFTLRVPNLLIQEIDKARETKIAKVSRNQWILEAIEKHLKGD